MTRSTRAPIVLALVVAAAAAQAASPSPAAAAGDTLVVLVRHAEKAAAPADDPPLTPAGEARAQALAAVVADAHVSAIITTTLRRTRDTAAPVAAARGLRPVTVPPPGDLAAHAAAVASRVRAHGPGVVLVVGHSQTVPAIIAALGGPDTPALCEGTYATLFVLSLPASGPIRLIRATYGAPDPPDACTGAR